MIRLLHLTSTPRGIGGVERLLLDTVGKLGEREYQVTYCNLFSSAGETEFPVELRRRGARVLEMPARRVSDVPLLAERLVSLLRRESYDLLHMHMLHATVLGTFASRIARVPATVVTRHYTDEGYTNHGDWLRALDLRSVARAGRVVAVSGAVRDYLREHAPGAEGRLSVIHNGIDLDAFERASRAEPDAPTLQEWAAEGCWILGTVGNLHARKGHADLLHALARVRAHVDARLVIVGRGEERAPLEALAEELGVARAVWFAGYRPDVPALLRRLSLYVHPSRHEPFGISILEAMAASRPVVATAVGGVPEVVADRRTGLLVPPAAPGRLAAAILELLASSDTREALAVAGQARVRAEFTTDVVVSRYRALYGELASSTRRERASLSQAGSGTA